MNRPPASSTGRIASLDGLRGVAALVVLVHHGFLLFPDLARVEYREPISADPLERAVAFTPLHVIWAGDEAVLVFFVLSGLVLALPLFRPSRFSWTAYYPSRLVRLYLPVVGALLGAAVLYLVLPWGPGPAGSGTPQPLTLQQLVTDASLTRGSTSFIDNVLWSLHWELLFSLLLPVYVLVARLPIRHWTVLLLAVVAISSFARAHHVEAVAFLAVFAIGVVLAKHRDDLRALSERVEQLRHPAAAWWSALIAAVVALTLSWLPLPRTVSDALSWPALLLGATTLVVLAAAWPAMQRILESRVLRWAGAVSFSLYLTHLPIVSAVGHAFGPDRALSALLVSIPLSLAAAWLFLLIVERPGHRLARRLARRIERSARPRRSGPPTALRSGTTRHSPAAHPSTPSA